MTKLPRTIHKAEGFEPEQTQGYCLLPHHHSALAITNRLTGSQFRLWHYLMMIDPFADRNCKGEAVFHNIPSPTEIGKAIGSNPRTVEKDMERLEELGLYEKRIKSWQGYNLTAEEGRKISERMKRKTPKPLQDKSGYLTEDAAKQPDVALNNRDSGYLTEDAAKQPDIALNNRDWEPEPPPDKAPASPHTIQTYSDFIHTLSKQEREKFEKFGLKKASLLPNPPQLPQRWIEVNWQELSEQFKSTPEATAASVEDQDWTQHPDWESWLALMRESVPKFVAWGTEFDCKMRRAIADWANERGLIWGVET